MCERTNGINHRLCEFLFIPGGLRQIFTDDFLWNLLPTSSISKHPQAYIGSAQLPVELFQPSADSPPVPVPESSQDWIAKPLKLAVIKLGIKLIALCADCQRRLFA